jgi:hypothetical protein
VTAAPGRRASSWGRLAVAIALSIVVGGAAAAAALVGSVYHAGTIEVEIDEAGGDHVSVVVPSSLVNLAVRLLPDRVACEAAAEIAPYWDGARAAARELARAPDGVYVQVDGPDVNVLVAKDHGRLRIDVVEEEDRVHVSVPLATVLQVVEKLEPAPPRNNSARRDAVAAEPGRASGS